MILGGTPSSIRNFLCVACFYFLASSAASATDLCLPIRRVMRWEGEKAPAIYQSCVKANDLFNEINHDLGIRAFKEPGEVFAYLPGGKKTMDPQVEKKSKKWQIQLDDTVRQNRAAATLLGKYLLDMQQRTNSEEEESVHAAYAKLESAVAAHARILLKGELLKQFIMIANGDFKTKESLEREFKKFLDDEATIFRLPGKID